MRIDLKVDAAPLVLRLEKGERRLAYAVVNAIRDTALRIQAAERRRVEETFTIRRGAFMMRMAAIIKPFPSVAQQRPFAEISVGQKKGLLLSRFERGGKRPPATPGAKRVAVPITGGPARPSFGSQVPQHLEWKKLKLRKRRVIGTTASGRARRTKPRTSGIWYGEHGTYMIPSIGVFQRKRQTGVRRLLYWFEEEPQLKPTLGFIETAEEEAHRWFGEEMQRQVVSAIGHARGRGL